MTLKLLPSPRARGVEAITSAELLARKAARGDRDAECARLALLVTERTATIVALREELDEAREEIAALRALTPPRPSRLAALWAALCLLWQDTTPATPRWAWPSMLALLTLALAIVRW